MQFLDRIKKNDTLIGISQIMAGVCIHLIIGSIYLWGIIVMYVSSYFRIIDHENITTSEASVVFPIMFFLIVLIFPFGISLADKIGYSLATILEGVILVAAIFISSFLKNFLAFIFVYGLGFGLMTGLLYMFPIYNAAKYFPEKKGLVSGIILGAFGLSALISGFIAQGVVNPEDYKPVNGYFKWNVGKKFPDFLKILSAYFLGLIILAFLFMLLGKKHKKLENNEEILELELEKEEQNLIEKEPPLTSVFYYPQIYFLFGMILFGSGYGLLMAGNFKAYGMTKINDDEFLTVVGSLGAVSNSLSRVFWGFLFDRFQNFRAIYLSLLSLQVILIITVDFISKIKALYLIWIFLGFGCLGGHFALFPPITMKVFGLHFGSKVYSFPYFGFGFSTVLSFLIVFFLKSKIGFANIFWIYLGFSLIAMILAVFFKEKTIFK